MPLRYTSDLNDLPSYLTPENSWDQAQQIPWVLPGESAQSTQSPSDGSLSCSGGPVVGSQLDGVFFFALNWYSVFTDSRTKLLYSKTLCYYSLLQSNFGTGIIKNLKIKPEACSPYFIYWQ